MAEFQKPGSHFELENWHSDVINLTLFPIDFVCVCDLPHTKIEITPLPIDELIQLAH